MSDYTFVFGFLVAWKKFQWMMNLRGSSPRYPQMGTSFEFLLYRATRFLAIKIWAYHHLILMKHWDYVLIMIEDSLKNVYLARAKTWRKIVFAPLHHIHLHKIFCNYHSHLQNLMMIVNEKKSNVSQLSFVCLRSC